VAVLTGIATHVFSRNCQNFPSVIHVVVVVCLSMSRTNQISWFINGFLLKNPAGSGDGTLNLEARLSVGRTKWAMASVAMEESTGGYMAFNGILRVNHKSMDWLRKISQP
jgi:hypothetical protein